MTKRIEIDGSALEKVSGGEITYTWDGTTGSLGIGGNNPYRLVDKDAFLEYWFSAQETTSDIDMIRYMYQHGIIEKP